MRIVSLLPSATEILFALGLGDSVVGVTHECDHPPDARSRAAVTEDLLPPGLAAAEIDAAVAAGIRDDHTIYRLDEERLRALSPDLVVTQSLCGVCAVPTSAVEAAVCTMPRAARVVSSDPHDLEGILATISEVAGAAGAPEAGARLQAALIGRLERVSKTVADRPRPRVAVLEWPDPPYAPGHWVPDMVAEAGAENVLGESGAPSVAVDWDAILEGEPDVVVLAFCGFDLEETQRRVSEIPPERWAALTGGRQVIAVDGSAYFSRPGPRVVDGVELLAWALHGADGLRPPAGRGAMWRHGAWVDLADGPSD